MSEEDQIRRLLAEARHDEPMPPDVADRMDAVIADLHADRPVGTVTDLAAARRRRRARVLLAAAAAVVVVGVGVDQLRGSDLGAGGSADSGAGSAESSAGGARSGDRAEEAPSPAQDFAAQAQVPVSPDRFARVAARLQHQTFNRDDVNGTTGSSADALRGGALYDLPKATECRTRGPGRALPVRYDGQPALLVYRPATSDTQVVDLILCGHSGIARTITLPAP